MARNNDLYQNQYEYEQRNRRNNPNYVVADTRGLQLDDRSRFRLMKMTKDAMRPDVNQPRNYINIFGTFQTSQDINWVYLEKEVKRGTGINEISNNRIVVTGIYLGYVVRFQKRPSDGLVNSTLNFAIYEAHQKSNTVTATTFLGAEPDKVSNKAAGMATRSGFQTPSYKTLLNRLVAVDGYTMYRAGRISNMNIKGVVTEFVDGTSAETVSGGHFLQIQHDTTEGNALMDIYVAIQLEFFYP